MLTKLKEFRILDKSIINLTIVEFFVQLINVSFVAILPLYMKAEHFSDAQYAHFTSYRYLGMLALALFVGMYIKGRRILPLFYIAAAGVPFFAFLIIIGVHIHSTGLLLMAHLLWGTAYTFIQIPILPYILRNAPKEQHTLAITLNFATWSIASIISGLFIGIFNRLDKNLFTERNLLLAIAVAGFSAVYFILKISKKEYIPASASKTGNLKDYDWKIISRALIPTTIIAIGAGFTVPFMSLFFSNVHHMSTSSFSFLNFFTAVLVTIAAVYVPSIKSRFGYLKAIPTTQSFAICALVLMATTQYYADLPIAIIIASIFFVLRQPFMSAAVPMTSEVTMKYVGERNREMVSALTSSIWSGSAYFSAIGFGILRHLNVNYVNIFLITAVTYVVGVTMYYFLLVDFYKREKLGLVTD
ncbi:MAG TPA: MFS transporter [Bacteroidia bacterium]|jgi:MFS family permease|nr:MFS transporter [Bacteroidia bacterium]